MLMYDTVIVLTREDIVLIQLKASGKQAINLWR